MPPPPVENVGLDPHSEEYFQKLVATLDLDTDTYAYVDPDTYAHVDLVIMKQLQELIRKHSHAFYLPGSQLGTIKGYDHHTATGDSHVVYRLPYGKSPSKLAAIKDELQKMPRLHIIRPSFPPGEPPAF